MGTHNGSGGPIEYVANPGIRFGRRKDNVPGTVHATVIDDYQLRLRARYSSNLAKEGGQVLSFIDCGEDYGELSVPTESSARTLNALAKGGRRVEPIEVLVRRASLR